ncbi:MAG TPA: branched-chain amino acid ABC transporter permease [Spirochaetota bacterium]|nr:branched-chain amino acid ABC transporter permease [Spirochaetota bacterium]HPF07048.1 branched-chain amino acid ABC transporter permease [Spirochaetota bacterium]HPJ40685.1 branched-chain amino acid ABC transporter permease [Spirochaetota bacterium]HPR35953.1 branched-chain amino acid ABC transporter permease [Spirochaetota bacterium]HRX48315.1 branched-chain amino acid ABC transporter permease [Spirochaetota bacterium]
MESERKKRKLLTLAALLISGGLLLLFTFIFDSYQLRIVNLCGIYITLGLSLNLIYGFTGLFSLGHAGFMAVGAYTTALLTMPPQLKEMNFFLEPIVPWLANTEWSFLPALLMGGTLAAVVGFLIGAPVLKLKDDYLAIATLGFAEIIRIVFTNTQNITNGPLGLKGLPPYTTIWWSWGIAFVSILFMVYLFKGSYGRAFIAIREDEVAAETMGINLFRHKILSFTIGSFMAGVGGGLLAHLMGTIDPLMFRFMLTFNILLVVVLGGMGSISGSVIAAIVITVLMEYLRFLDGPMNFGLFKTNGIPGMRMVIFSIMLMFVILFFQRGLMGNRELSWDFLFRKKKTLNDAVEGD